ncbi:MAG: hypothetical protein ABR499_22200 [Gemmatimonadaceae bacterium]
MKPSFCYDAAISAVGYDAATAQRLANRLRPRLSLPVFNTWDHHGTVVGDGSTGLAARVLQSEARVVVVLHQRLWGETTSTELEAKVLEQRAALEGTTFLHVIPLEEAEPPAWMPRSVGRGDASDASLDAAVEAVVAAVVAAGGSARPEPSPRVEIGATTDGRPDQGRGSFSRSSGGTLASTREFTALIDEIERELSERCRRGSELTPQVYRTPDRLIVQLGAVGLSVSRMRSDPGVPAETSLLVIEWKGTITQPGSSRARGDRATPLREHVLRADTDKTTAWRWLDADGGGQRVYASRDLAAQCVHLLVRQAEADTVAGHAAA